MDDRRILLLLLACVGPLLCASGALPGVEPGSREAALAASHRVHAAELARTNIGLPVRIEADVSEGRVQGDVYGIIDHPFEILRGGLESASSWCEAVPLHLNVKSCTHEGSESEGRLAIFSGRKFYERPESAHRMEWAFEVAHSSETFFEVILESREGPLDTRDYAIRLEAIPVGDRQSFAHFQYTYRPGVVARVATRGYLATVARRKSGFSVVGTDDDGNPVYASGIQGAIERNAIRYHLAIQAHLDTLESPEPERFERRIARWFDLTSVYGSRLYELDRVQYLDIKRRERADQERLQRALESDDPGLASASLAP